MRLTEKLILLFISFVFCNPCLVPGNFRSIQVPSSSGCVRVRWLTHRTERIAKGMWILLRALLVFVDSFIGLTAAAN